MSVQTIGRYEIRAEIRRGGMSTIYRAYDPHFEREVAIKVLPPELLHDPTFAARFKREAKIIAAVEHVAIVPVYDFGEDNGRLFLVMRLMTGGSLADRLKFGPIPTDEILHIFSRISSALDEAHNNGIIHRDLKPANILFDGNGEAYLSDFGIAKLRQSAGTLTDSNVIVGTPAYMSPEQARGEKDIDGRCDIYSLGAILFEMLSGHVPYESETPTGQIVLHITEPIPDIRTVRKDLPPAAQTVIATALAKKKVDRYTNAAEMTRAFKDAISDTQGTVRLLPRESKATVPAREQSVPISPPLVVARVQPAAQRIQKGKPNWLLYLVAVIALLVVIALFTVMGGLLLPALFAADTPTLLPSLTLTLLPTETEPIPTDTLLPSDTPTLLPSSTASLEPSPTSIFTPTPIPMAIVSVAVANVRSGPGTVYDQVMTVVQGTALQVVGRSSTNEWLVVWLPELQRNGWISITVVTIDFDLLMVPVIAAPPSPTPRPTTRPTETDRPPPPPSLTPTESQYPYP